MTELLVDRDGGVLRVTLNAPERRNAVDTNMVHAIADALENHADARVVVLAGAGESFCSGVKLSPGRPNAGFLDAAARLITAITEAPIPIVAAVDGPAAGFGCSIALAADLTIASERSYFLQAFVNIGLMPDGGANELLAASIGRARALWLTMNGERVWARDALAMGLIGSCVRDDEHADAVEALVSRLAGGPTLALARTKRAINRASIPTLTQTLAFEHEEQDALLGTHDYREGVAAFAQKRPPSFFGR